MAGPGPILVIEDDEPTRRALCALLDVSGLPAAGARDGADAIAWLGRTGMNGCQFREWQRRTGADLGTPRGLSRNVPFQRDDPARVDDARKHPVYNGVDAGMSLALSPGPESTAMKSADVRTSKKWTRADRWKHLVLVVDDDVEHRRDVCELLQEEGYRTIAAWNGREAFGLLLTAGVAPSLILLDLVMDSVDGAEFRRRQLDHPRFARVPVVVVSGRPDAARRAASMDVAGFLPKPLDALELLGTVDRLVSR